MKLVILDLEFENQGGRDIIQVGAVEVDLLRSIVSPFFNEYVALPEGVQLSDYISNLCGIYQEDLDQARPPEEVFKSFWKKFARASVKYRLAGWGDDAEWIRQESERYGVRVPKRLDEYDLKQTFQFFRFQRGLSSRHKTGLLSTIQAFGLEFEGRPHDGYDDAYNTGRVLVEALKSPSPQDQ